MTERQVYEPMTADELATQGTQGPETGTIEWLRYRAGQIIQEFGIHIGFSTVKPRYKLHRRFYRQTFYVGIPESLWGMSYGEFATLLTGVHIGAVSRHDEPVTTPEPDDPPGPVTLPIQVSVPDWFPR